MLTTCLAWEWRMLTEGVWFQQDRKSIDLHASSGGIYSGQKFTGSVWLQWLMQYSCSYCCFKTLALPPLTLFFSSVFYFRLKKKKSLFNRGGWVSLIINFDTLHPGPMLPNPAGSQGRHSTALSPLLASLVLNSYFWGHWHLACGFPPQFISPVSNVNPG